jgi:hypothetical protein
VRSFSKSLDIYSNFAADLQSSSGLTEAFYYCSIDHLGSTEYAVLLSREDEHLSGKVWFDHLWQTRGDYAVKNVELQIGKYSYERFKPLDIKYNGPSKLQILLSQSQLVG